ncbi:hypothetical protein PV433_31300 [Paenibacillus sp. GYB004]|uniref:hypothetical protein n=1 Tax=Paenibacillus sp. GYB004 TaxID=2994393 RepID=UPI002F966257
MSSHDTTDNERETGKDRLSRRKMLAILGTTGAAIAAGSTAVWATSHQAGSGNMQVTLLELSSVPDLEENQIVRTTGYYTAGDGGGAEYIIRTAQLPEDGGSVINLANGLQAHLLPVPSVNYALFGAKGDGVGDDGVPIKKAHAYANSAKLPVIQLSGEFWIKETNLIPIQTNVQWGQTIFHIDESYNVRDKQRFLISSAKLQQTISLGAAEKAALLSKLKPGTTIISELAAYKNCLVIVADSNDRIGIRAGYAGNTGWAKEELFVVEEHGRIIGDIAWTFQNYTSLTAYPCDDSYLVVEGGTFYLSGNNPGQNQGYWNNGFSIRRSRTIIRNQWVGLEPGQTDVSLDPRNGFYTFTNSYDVTLENVRLLPWEKDRPGTTQDVPQGTYGIGGSRVLNATFRNVTAEGSTIHWGVFGTNLFKNFRVENCRLNRIDVHFHCWNLYVRDSEIGFHGFTLTGGGDLFVENTKRFGNDFLSFRQDYGAKWDGHIRLTNCRLVVTNPNSEARALNFSPSDFDYKYPIGYGQSIRVHNFVFDFVANPAGTGVCRVMKTAAFSATSQGHRLFFPQLIEFVGVTVTGREKGVRIMEIPNPFGYDVRKPGGYDDQQVRTNCYMRFENIQCEKTPAQASQSVSHVNFMLGGLSTAPYADDRALYPKIEMVNCGDLFVHFKGASADVRITGCRVNSIDAYEGGPMRGRIVFDSCDIQADVIEDNKSFFYLSTQHGVTFLNCTIHPPIVDGTPRPDLLARYEFIDVNNKLQHSHLNTRLSKSLHDYFATAGISILPEYIDMLKSHHEKDSIWMALRKGSTADRPAPSKFQSEIGFVYYDTDLGRMIVWNGTAWSLPAAETGSCHFYGAVNAQTPAGGTVLKRAEGHPTQEALMPRAGRLTACISHIAAGSDTAVTFDIWKNGQLWIGGLAATGNAGETHPLPFPPAADPSFSANDRLGIRVHKPSSAEYNGTIDLLASYSDNL